MPAANIYSPDPNILERRFATYLARRSADTSPLPEPARVEALANVTRWTITLAILAGIISGGLIGGTEVWIRQGVLDGLEDVDWRQTWPYWAAFFAFAGVISAVEIVLLYALALNGIARITRHSGLALSQEEGRGLFAHGLARTALEFPSPQIRVYGIDPYAYVANWKLLALNIAYKLKVGVSSFILRVFLRRVAARLTVRGMAPLFAAPLYAAWNAYIIWRILSEARVRTLAPFAIDNLIKTRFPNDHDLGDTAANIMLHAAGEMMTRGRDAHPNHVYLMNRLHTALHRSDEVTLDWPAMHMRLPRLDNASQTAVLDLLTLSCMIGSRIHRQQFALLRSACSDCGTTLQESRVKALRKAMMQGQSITGKDLSATRDA